MNVVLEGLVGNVLSAVYALGTFLACDEDEFPRKATRASNGPAYFDSSHFPCSGGQGAGKGNPKRVSLWEIHPIYKFEVCTANCAGAGTWVALDQWVKQQQ